MTKKPHADTELARYIDRRILELKAMKTQAQIAAEAGYPNPNMITMIKQGTSKVALDRVPALAKALDCTAHDSGEAGFLVAQDLAGHGKADGRGVHQRR